MWFCVPSLVDALRLSTLRATRYIPVSCVVGASLAGEEVHRNHNTPGKPPRAGNFKRIKQKIPYRQNLWLTMCAMREDAYGPTKSDQPNLAQSGENTVLEN